MFEAFIGSVEGPYHRQHNVPNQDYVAFHDSEKVFYAALADGAGSLKHADIGAQEAVEVALKVLQESAKSLDAEKLVEYSIAAARDRIQNKQNYKEYGSTLVTVVLTSKGEATVACVGDSFLILHFEDGSHKLVRGVPLGEYANQTELLTSDEISITVESFTEVKGFSLSSDGLESVAIENNEAHNGFWSGIIKKAVAGDFQVDRLFRWLDSLDKLSDDTTLLTVVRK